MIHIPIVLRGERLQEAVGAPVNCYRRSQQLLSIALRCADTSRRCHRSISAYNASACAVVARHQYNHASRIVSGLTSLFEVRCIFLFAFIPSHQARPCIGSAHSSEVCRCEACRLTVEKRHLSGLHEGSCTLVELEDGDWIVDNSAVTLVLRGRTI